MSDLNKTDAQDAATAQESKYSDQVMRPAVDVFEDETGITVQADMPGVSRDKLDIRIDNDTLLFEGEAALPMPENMEAVYADVRSTRYQRSFALSRELDAERTEASLKNGVLILRIPKREHHQPRKIEVRVG